MSQAGKTYSASIVLTRVADGKSATTKLIETDSDEILKFNTKDGVSFSPDYLKVQVVDATTGEVERNYSWTCSYLKGQDYEKFATSSGNGQYADAFLYRTSAGQFTTSKPDDFDAFYIDAGALYKLATNQGSQIKTYIDDGAFVMKIVIGDSNPALGIKYLTIKNGISADMATLNIGAKDITAAIRDSSLQFSADGLKLEKGHFTICDSTYTQQTLTKEQFDAGDNYYFLDANDKYQLADYFDASVTYYTKNEDPVFFADDAGNLNLKGIITATGGSFTGVVHATAGEFEGTVTAKEGSIGGFTISENTLNSADNLVILDGKNGKITAENIDLGSGAKVTDKIEFCKDGNASTFSLYNPENHSYNLPSGIAAGGKVLEAANIILTNKGYLQLGTLELYGGTGNTDGYIRSVHIDDNSQTQNGWWRINEDGSSYFDTIYVDNAHIKNSIMEQKTVQFVGSTMVFKESWTIESTHNLGEKLGYRLDGEANLVNGDYIFVGDNIYKISGIQLLEQSEPLYIEAAVNKESDFNPERHYIKGGDGVFSRAPQYEPDRQYYLLSIAEGTYTCFSISGDSESGKLSPGAVVTRLGRAGECVYTKALETEKVPGRFYFTKGSDGEYIEYQDEQLQANTDYYYKTIKSSSECVISIEGNESAQNSNVGNMSVPQALSFASFYNDGSDENPKMAYTKHLILGRLDNSGIDALNRIEGYGLYADNVFLNGSLVTKGLEDGYAGINTASSISFQQWPKNKENPDTSNIIMWGGAKSQADADVQNAPFQVTRLGTLYAQNAVIKNSIFTDGEISAAIIKTARIYGSKDGENVPLTIHDAKTGIAFMSGTEDDNTQNTTVLGIGSEGFINQNEEIFLKPNGNTEVDYPIFYGLVQARSKKDGYKVTHLTSGISFDKTGEDGKDTPLGKIKPYYDPANERGEILISVGNYNNEDHSAGIMSFQSDRIVAEVQQYFDEGAHFGKRSDGSYIMEFKKQSTGYDLIIN